MTKLETKVAARNEVNTIARAYTAKCRLALAPLVGQKISLAAGGNSANFKKLADSTAIPTSCYISTGHGYSVTANFRACKTSTSSATEIGRTFYAEATLCLYDIKDGVMVQNDAYLNHIDSEHYRTDFSAAEILAARKKVAETTWALDAAKSALCSFGEHDNG